MTFGDTGDIIKAVLSHNVPRFIQHIKDRGDAPSDEEFGWLQNQVDDPNYPEGMLARADEYLLYPTSEETFQKALFVLVLMLAIMSFFPGGIRMIGLRFSSDLETFWEDD